MDQMKKPWVAAAFGLGFVLGCPVAAVAADAFSVAAGPAEGEIVVPDVDFHREWVFLGAFSVDFEDGTGAQALHNVYAEPWAVDAYRRNGVFPDGAVVIKDLFNTKTDDLTTGRASWAFDHAGWFVMIKDSQNRFADAPDWGALWGDGWGWAFFETDQPKQTVSTDYQSDCLGCHVPVQETDWLHIQGYPVLAGRD
ncbi:MAG: cytochrome P460 family protein [Alphaproteobacteria bacterium]|nr:cytochrome P460 family protein [Alphaproteobacteria bacterium]